MGYLYTKPKKFQKSGRFDPDSFTDYDPRFGGDYRHNGRDHISFTPMIRRSPYVWDPSASVRSTVAYRNIPKRSVDPGILAQIDYLRDQEFEANDQEMRMDATPLTKLTSRYVNNVGKIAPNQINQTKRTVPVQPEPKASQIENEFVADTGVDGKYAGVAGSLAGLLKPALNLSNVLIQKRQIDDAARKASRYIAPQLVAPVKGVAPVQDVPQELLAARVKEIGDIHSQYKGSDVVSDVLSKNMTEQTKAQMMDKIGAERSAHLLTERNRVNTAVGENQATILDTRNKQSVINAEEDRRIRDIEPAHSEAIRDLTGKAINETVGALDTAASYNLTKQLKEQDARLNNIDKAIQDNLDQQRLRPYDVSLQKEFKQLTAERLGVVDKAMPSYNTFNAGAFGYRSPIYSRRGGKLIART